MFGDRAMYQGNVVWFNSVKGYGFIKEASGREVFCHFSAVKMAGYKSLHDGQSGLSPGQSHQKALIGDPKQSAD